MDPVAGGGEDGEHADGTECWAHIFHFSLYINFSLSLITRVAPSISASIVFHSTLSWAMNLYIYTFLPLQ